MSVEPSCDAQDPQDGTEPDYRFTLANERTYLAWIRTCLALLAGGVAVVSALPDSGLSAVRRAIGAMLVALAGVLCGASLLRWERVQRAMRRSQPLPRSPLPVFLVAGLTPVIVLVLVLTLTGRSR